MNTSIEILRRLRFLWALCWLGITVAMAVYSPALFPLRIIPPLLAALAPYYGPMPLRLALTWAGVFVTLGLALATGHDSTGDSFASIFVIAPGGAVAILVLSFLLSPLFKRKET